MNAIFVTMGALVLIPLTFFFIVIASTLFGGITGWMVGLVFGDTILAILAQLGLHGITMWQVGLFLGFVGGFLRTKITNSKNE